MIKKEKRSNLLIESLQEVLEDIHDQKKLKSRNLSIEDIDVISIRKKYDLSQLEFSEMFGFSLRTLQQWEQGRRRPQGAARVLLKVIDYAPDVVDKALHH